MLSAALRMAWKCLPASRRPHPHPQQKTPRLPQPPHPPYPLGPAALRRHMQFNLRAKSQRLQRARLKAHSLSISEKIKLLNLRLAKRKL